MTTTLARQRYYTETCILHGDLLVRRLPMTTAPFVAWHVCIQLPTARGLVSIYTSPERAVAEQVAEWLEQYRARFVGPDGRLVS